MPSMYDLRRLQVLVAVADHGSFSHAADALGYTQSVVSHHVAALEQEVGIKLVDRSVRPVALTEAGRRLRERAATILGEVGDAEAELRALTGGHAGELRLGAHLAACVSIVPRAVARFEAVVPGVEVQLEQLRTDDSVERVRSGSLDLAIIWRPAGDGDELAPGLVREPLGVEPYRLALAADHPLADRDRIAWAELAGERFTVPFDDFADGRRYRAWLRGRCRAAGFEPDCRYPVEDVATGQAWVASGACVGLLPHMTLAQPQPGVVVRAMESGDAFRALEAIWREGRRLPAIAPMVARLRATTAELMAQLP